MMRFLIPDITLHCGDLGRAYAECPITFLPPKPLTQPTRRTAFELLNRGGEARDRRYSDKQMQVIGIPPAATRVNPSLRAMPPRYAYKSAILSAAKLGLRSFVLKMQ